MRNPIPIRRPRRILVAVAAATAAVLACAAPAVAAQTNHTPAVSWGQSVLASQRTTTPIKHVVVIYDENVSFDHYFGTYPDAANTDGTKFKAAKNTPAANTLLTSGRLTNNPNLYKPQRLTPAEALTCDQNHSYTPEQKAVDGGKMDAFVQNTSTDTCTGEYGAPGLAMDYYDGNTVTAMWNLAQNYSMSDNSWDSTFGPSTPGALNLISGQTHGATPVDPKTGAKVASSTAIASLSSSGIGTIDGDADPAYDDCSDTNHTSSNPVVEMSGKNIGDLLNAKHVTWGWFQGGFAPTTKWNGKAGDYAACGATTTNVGGSTVIDYSPHHNPFEYYKSTANPHHLPPSSEKMIGHTDQANHEYDLSDFSLALSHDNLPAVSFLKAPEAQDGHAGYSDPLDEQKFVVDTVDSIEKSKDWASTAIVIAYDDSDGWYDHVAPKIANDSHDATADTTLCTSVSGALGGYQDRRGPSQRLPMLVISPFAKQNHVDHTKVIQPSILSFIEQNWRTGTIGDASFDRTAGSIDGMFDFRHPQQREVLLKANGSVAKVVKRHIRS